jgi:hypothetical protein
MGASIVQCGYRCSSFFWFEEWFKAATSTWSQSGRLQGESGILQSQLLQEGPSKDVKIVEVRPNLGSSLQHCFSAYSLVSQCKRNQQDTA